MNKKLSVITVNYNNREGLKMTLDSVFVQEYKSIEFIVVDGGSDDGSKALLEENAGKISKWISEKDEGIYNAMNKGIRMATGEYVYFLNSGDRFYNKKSAEAFFSSAREADIICGGVEFDNPTNTWVKPAPVQPTFEYFLSNNLVHQSAAIRRELFSAFGEYNERTRIVADWEFFVLVLCKHNATYASTDAMIAVFNSDGVSSKPESQEIINCERERVLQKEFNLFLDDYKKMDRYKSELNTLQNSRAIKLVRRFMHTGLYQFFKK